ncbi:MAG: hypothetical protein WC495_05850 [Patescibacteria group bacterium]|jgi:hypothetical protein
MSDKKDKLKEIEEARRKAWKAFQKLNFDKLTNAQRVEQIQELYGVMSLSEPVDETEVPFDFWTEYENTEEIKDIKKFKDYVANTLKNLPTNPTKESWLDRERGIISNMKREWKAKVEPFKDERKLKKLMEEKINELLQGGKNNFSVNYNKTIKKMVENIEETLYQPTRKEIEKIETEIKKRTA